MKNHNYTQKEITFCNNVRWGLLTYTALVILVVLLSAHLSDYKAQKQSDLYQYPTHNLKVSLNQRKAAKKPFLQVTGWDVAAWGGSAVAGSLWGMREALHAQPTVFEERFGADKYSFWGSAAWERNYEGNRYRNEDGTVNQHKPELGNTLRDIWHFGGTVSPSLYAGATFTIALQKKNGNWKAKLGKAVIGSLIRSASANVTYKYLRYGKVF